MVKGPEVVRMAMLSGATGWIRLRLNSASASA
jgi:hypothetical protein